MSTINYYYTDYATPDSGAISEVYFDEEGQDAVVVFNGGGEYLYDDVSREDFDALVNASSPRTEWATNWKGVKVSERVDVYDYLDRAESAPVENAAAGTQVYTEAPIYKALSDLLNNTSDAAAADADDAVEATPLRDLVVTPDEVVSVPASENGRAVNTEAPYRRYVEVTLLVEAGSVDEALDAVREGDVYDAEVLSVRAV